MADDARAVPEAEKGAPLGALDVFDAGALCEGSCLLVELSGPSGSEISNAIVEAPSSYVPPSDAQSSVPLLSA